MLHIVTVATKNDGYFDFLVDSCKQNGGNLEVLGWGTQWKGFSYRIKLMQDYLQNLDDNDIVCFIDGYDVIILQPIEKLEQIFKDSGKGIIFSRDVNANIMIETYISLYYGKCKNYNINAGTYIGYVKYLKELYKKIMQDYDVTKQNDDQIILSKMCNEISNVGIDIKREMFLVINYHDKEIDEIKFKNNKLIFKDIYPCILHAPTNYDLNHILQNLGYNVDSTKRRDFISYFYVFLQVKQIQFILITIILIIIFVVLIYQNYNKIKTFVRKYDIMRKK